MDWTDEGIVLSHRAHGETSAIAEVFSRRHGRHLGLVRGGRSRQMRPVLQIGNHVDATWMARLAEQLGQFRLELRTSYAAKAMPSGARLAALSSVCALLKTLPERDAHPNLYEVTLFLLSFFDDDDVWPALVVRWELTLLEELGFGLDLTACAATGGNDDLVYVSPRTGRAVSASAGEPYADRLLALPAFLIRGREAAVTAQDIRNGFGLTGYFLEKWIYHPRDERLPEIRSHMVELLCKE